MKNYYQILEVSENSSIEEIKQAYRKLAKQYHPDINKLPDAHHRFIEISEAYEVLFQRAACKDKAQPQVDYEEFLRDVRETAKKQARMRYEKFEHQHKAFRESGLYDVGLLFKYIGKILLPIISLCMIFIPVSVCISERSIFPFFYLCFFWLIGGFLLYNSYQQKDKYFNLGKFYYSYNKIKELYIRTNDNTLDECFYCNGLKANSIPFKMELIKVKDIKLRNNGPMQHQAGYNRKNIIIIFPRSQKAFIIHSIISTLKLCCILGSLLFLPITSIVWRFIGGILLGWMVSSALLLFFQTRSKTAYMISYGMMIKIILWLSVISYCSVFNLSTFNIYTTALINFGIVFYLFLDAFTEQILKIPHKLNLFKPLPKQYINLTKHFEEKCMLYLEIPFWTTIYPFVRWIF